MPAFRFRRSLAVLVVAGLCGLAVAFGGSTPAVAGGTAPARFKIGLIGDTGYSAADDKLLLAVQRSMATYNLAFEAHDGDIQLSGSRCTDARLAAIRRIFFSTGPAGGGPAAADLAWLNGTFDAAEAAGAAGVMIIWQDDPFLYGADQALLKALKKRTIRFGKPVVLVHGDTHKHRVDKPWSDVANFTRVETFAGDQSNQWVLATVAPGQRSVFSFGVVTAK